MTTVLKSVEADEFYTRPDFETILLSDIANANAALVFPIVSSEALKYFDIDTDSWSEMVQHAYGAQHPDPRLEEMICELSRVIRDLSERVAALREDASVLSSAWSRAAQAYLTNTGRNIGYSTREVFLHTTRSMYLEFELDLILERSVVHSYAGKGALYRAPRWFAELASGVDNDPWPTHIPSRETTIVAVPASSTEERLLIAMLEHMTLTEAADAARLLSHTG
jgi:hypothetical protein